MVVSVVSQACRCLLGSGRNCISLWQLQGKGQPAPELHADTQVHTQQVCAVLHLLSIITTSWLT
jgi:hypothetical protein